MNAPFDANSTASGRNTNPSGGFNSGSSSSQPVPSYQDPNQIRPNNNPPIDNTFPQNSSQPPQNDPFPADTNDQFQSNKNSTSELTRKYSSHLGSKLSRFEI